MAFYTMAYFTSFLSTSIDTVFLWGCLLGDKQGMKHLDRICPPLSLHRSCSDPPRDVFVADDELVREDQGASDCYCNR